MGKFLITKNYWDKIWHLEDYIYDIILTPRNYGMGF